MSKKNALPKWKLTSLYTISEFAKDKGVNRKNVYRAIHKGDIVPVLIGKYQCKFIDFETYGSYDFKRNSV